MKFKWRKSKTSSSSLVLLMNMSMQLSSYFQGIQVHIRKPKIKSISVDRKLLLELKQVWFHIDHIQLVQTHTQKTSPGHNHYL